MNAMNAMTKCSLFAAAALQVAILPGVTVVPITAAQAADATVKIDNFTFAPQQFTVKIGTTVTWDNEDDTPHTVVSSTKLFRSNALDTGGKFSLTFTTPGVYQYFCSLHPHMIGTIVVEATTGAKVVQ
jgi:plastocyanin